jgi:signal transduction histidine kinase
MSEDAERIEALERRATAMVHDFNNVLMCVLQVAEMLGRFYPDDPRLARMAEQLSNAALRGRRITSEALLER